MTLGARHRLLILGITLVACVLLLLAARGRRRQPQPAEPASIGNGVLNRAAIEQLLPHLPRANWVRFDPLAIVRVVPDKTDSFDFAEHAGGKVTLRTNNFGFREDAPTAPGPPAPGTLRVLVLGDSHTFGFVENDETFANVLERRLQAREPRRRWEVLNAGVGGVGPYEERALLGVLLDLQPQLVLCVLYTGNDFVNAQSFWDFETRRARVPLPRDAQARYKEAREHARERMAQNTNQVHNFVHRAGDDEVALLATLQCYREMAQYCSERGARFLVAVLPAKEDVDVHDLDEMAATREELLLCEADYALIPRLAGRLSDTLRSEGIAVLDLLPSLAGQPRRMYWKRDHHLSVDGHAVVARALEEPVLAALAAARAPGADRAR